MTALAFAPPDAGIWEQDATHFPRPMTRFLQEAFRDGFIRGFQTGSACYGLLLDHIEPGFVNGFFYNKIGHRRRPGECQRPAAETRLQADVHAASGDAPPPEDGRDRAAAEALARAPQELGHGAEAEVDAGPPASAVAGSGVHVRWRARGVRRAVFRELEGHGVPASHLHHDLRRGDRRFHGVRAGVDGAVPFGDRPGAEGQHAHLVRRDRRVPCGTARNRCRCERDGDIERHRAAG